MKALALYQLGKYQEAIDNCDKAIGLNQQYAEPYNIKGNCLQKLMNYAGALNSYNMSIAANVEYSPAYWNKANLLKFQGNEQEAKEFFDKAIKLKPELASYTKGDIILTNF